MVFYFCFPVFWVPLRGIFKCGTQRCLVNGKEQRNGNGLKREATTTRETTGDVAPSPYVFILLESCCGW